MKRRCRWWCEAVMCVLKENYIFCGDTKLLNVWTWSYIICGHEAMKPYCRCWYEALCFKCRWLRGHVTWRQWPRAGKPTIQLWIPLHSTLTAGAGNLFLLLLKWPIRLTGCWSRWNVFKWPDLNLTGERKSIEPGCQSNHDRWNKKSYFSSLHSWSFSAYLCFLCV